MKILQLTLAVVFLAFQVSQAQLITPSNKPNKTQQLLIERGYGMFVHFGVNTFSNLEWSDGKTPASLYNPTALDCDQWVRIAREAGFRYVLLITKHHDGFCLWDSKYTEYDVASSPVKTDVVAEVAKACRKYGLEFGIYYSLWDRHQPSYKNPEKTLYVDYMVNQLTELLTNYGDVCELWFDGGWDRKVAEWDLDRLYKHVKKLQPTCAVGVNHTIVLEPGSRKFALPDSIFVSMKRMPLLPWANGWVLKRTSLCPAMANLFHSVCRQVLLLSGKTITHHLALIWQWMGVCKPAGRLPIRWLPSKSSWIQHCPLIKSPFLNIPT